MAVKHYAKEGLFDHWWGVGWHTSCGQQYETKDKKMFKDFPGADRENTTKAKALATCKLCRNSMDFYCKSCHRPPNKCKCEK